MLMTCLCVFPVECLCLGIESLIHGVRFQVPAGTVEAVPEGSQPVDQDINPDGQTRFPLPPVHDTHQ